MVNKIISLELQLATLKNDKEHITYLLERGASVAACEIPYDDLDPTTEKKLLQAVRWRHDDSWRFESCFTDWMRKVTIGYVIHSKFIYDDDLDSNKRGCEDYPRFGPKICPLQIAVLTNKPDLVLLFLNKSDEVKPSEVGKEDEDEDEYEDEEKDEEEEEEAFQYSHLEVAAWLGHKRIVEILLQSGPKVNPNDCNIGTAIKAASAQGHLNIIQLLEKNGGVQEGAYCTALCTASYWNRPGVVKYLLDQLRQSPGVKENLVFENALKAAMKGGSLEVLRDLLVCLEHSPDINHNQIFENALKPAVKGGNLEVLRDLLVFLEESPDINRNFVDALKAAVKVRSQATVANKEEGLRQTTISDAADFGGKREKYKAGLSLGMRMRGRADFPPNGATFEVRIFAGNKKVVIFAPIPQILLAGVLLGIRSHWVWALYIACTAAMAVTVACRS